MNAFGARSAERRLVWMLGFGRSGTTWLLNMLCRLPKVDGIDEPLIGAHLGISLGAALGGMIRDDRRLYEVAAGRRDYFFSEARRGVWEPALRRFVLTGLLAGRKRSTLVVVKEPNGSAAAPMIMSAFPASRLLYVVRDGRDVVDSGIDAWSGGWASEQMGSRIGSAQERATMLDTLARQWVSVNRAVQGAYEAHAPQRRMRVTYEELVADTPGVLGRIAAWLGRDVPRSQIEDIVRSLAFEAIPAEQRGPGRFVRAAQPGLWQEHFDDADRAILAETMGSMLTEMGYPSTIPSSSR